MHDEDPSARNGETVFGNQESPSDHQNDIRRRLNEEIPVLPGGYFLGIFIRDIRLSAERFNLLRTVFYFMRVLVEHQDSRDRTALLQESLKH
jgi:hypothetical protein